MGAVLNGYFYILDQCGLYNSQRINLCTLSHWEEVCDQNRQCNIGRVISSKTHLYSISNDGNMVFDPRTEYRTPCPQMIEPRSGFATVVVEQKIYVIGGYQSGKVVTWVETYDINTKMWSKAPDLPIGLYSAVASVIETRWIILIGGEVSALEWFPHCQGWISSKVELTAHRFLRGCFVFRESQLFVVGRPVKSTPKLSPIFSLHVANFVPNWYLIGHFVLLRHLVDQKRAHFLKKRKRKHPSHNIDPLSKNQIDDIINVTITVQKLVENLDIDTFRIVLS